MDPALAIVGRFGSALNRKTLDTTRDDIPLSIGVLTTEPEPCKPIYLTTIISREYFDNTSSVFARADTTAVSIDAPVDLLVEE